EDLPARDKKRYEAAMALIDSEREYYHQLCLIVGLFLWPLKKEGVLTGLELEDLFGNVEIIWGTHKIFLDALCRAASGWTTNSSLTSVLALFAPAFKMYGFYTARVGKAMVLVSTFKTKHEHAAEFKSILA